jgi:hypothetical protein
MKIKIKKDTIIGFLIGLATYIIIEKVLKIGITDCIINIFK